MLIFENMPFWENSCLAHLPLTYFHGNLPTLYVLCKVLIWAPVDKIESADQALHTCFLKKLQSGNKSIIQLAQTFAVVRLGLLGNGKSPANMRMNDPGSREPNVYAGKLEGALATVPHWHWCAHSQGPLRPYLYFGSIQYSWGTWLVAHHHWHCWPGSAIFSQLRSASTTVTSPGWNIKDIV